MGRALPRAVVIGGLSVGLLLVSFRAASATNATNLVSSSAAAQGMGGADLASLYDTSAMNANPAALSLLPRGDGRDPHARFASGMLDLSVGVLGPFLHHEDSFGNSRDGQNEPYLALHGGAAGRLRGLPGLSVGLGMFSQGGLGTDFRGLRTAFGTRDDVSSFLRYTKLVAALAYQVTDDLALGVAPHVGYSDLSFRLFPRTSSSGLDGVPGTADDFAGIDIGDRCARNFGVGEPGSDCPWDVALGVKVGALYRIGPNATLGVAYTSPVDFRYRDGRGRLNLSNVGLGRVEYDAEVDGFGWPQAVEAGVAVRVTPRLLLALDVGWHNWSSFDHLTFRFTNPRQPQAPRTVTLKLAEDWDDQWVVAVGAAYDVVPERLTVRAGYNFGNNPIPDRTFSPAAQVAYQHHVTAGLGYRPGPRWQLDTAFTYAFANRVTYTNPQMPFGPNATDAPAGLQVDVTVGYRF